MPKRPRVKPGELTRQYEGDELLDDEGAGDAGQKFGLRSKFHQQNKTQRTADERAGALDFDALPAGRVVQVHSLYCDVEPAGGGAPVSCVVRKTLQKTSATRVVVGDEVRWAPVPDAQPGAPAGTVEHVGPRRTLLTRADSFKAQVAWPIVANAERVLIVVAAARPFPRWGLVDRMIVAAKLGGLEPVVCVNKWDLVGETGNEKGETRDDVPSVAEAVDYYEARLALRVLRTSVTANVGLDDLRGELAGRVTVLAGHSGVGKSSLASAAQPGLELRVGEVSAIHDKGKHTTTSARTYKLGLPGHEAAGGEVVDTPGVKLFGLWGADEAKLRGLFPDVSDGSAPRWREVSYERLRAGL